MSQFLYFISDKSGVADRKLIESSGLGYALSDNFHSREVYSGPGGHGGILVGESEKGLSYQPDEQTWQSAHPGIHIGYWNDQKPTPEDLERPKLLNGKKLELDDGNQWAIPFVRRYESIDQALQHICVLPQKMDFQDGQWVAGSVVDQYKRLWDIATEVWDLMLAAASGGDTQLSTEANFAVEVLGFNYRIGPYEAAMLGLFLTDGRSVGSVMKTITDLDTFTAIVQKKTAGELHNTELGETAELMDTPQPLESLPQ